MSRSQSQAEYRWNREHGKNSHVNLGFSAMKYDTQTKKDSEALNRANLNQDLATITKSDNDKDAMGNQRKANKTNFTT